MNSLIPNSLRILLDLLEESLKILLERSEEILCSSDTNTQKYQDDVRKSHDTNQDNLFKITAANKKLSH